jgi:hypothetical protein
MGADFIYAIANITETKEHWHTILGELHDGKMEAYINESETLMYWSEDYDDLDTDSPEFFQAVAERVSDAIEVAYSDSRELGWLIDNSEEKWAITGGMSWGDAPTDIFHDLRIVDSFQTWYGAEGKHLS